MKKTLSLLIAALLLIVPLLPGASRTYAEESPADVLTVEELDPSTLPVPRLGVIEETSPDVPEIDRLEPYDLNKIVRASIFLDANATVDQGYSTRDIHQNSSATAYREQLQQQQKGLQSRIEQAVGHKLVVKWNLTLLTNAISVEVPYRDLAVIRRMPGVKSVALETQYEPPRDAEPAHPNTVNTSNNMVGAAAAWAEGYTGVGSRIAIIDTGIDTSHQSFAADGFDHAIAELNAADQLMTKVSDSVLNQLNAKRSYSTSLTVDDIYVSTKIPYAYNYVDQNTDVTHLNDNMGTHGSHVAGIAAANRYIYDDSTYQDAATYVKAVGMAPDAQLLIMKVFGASGGAYDSDYFSAIEDAIVLGCDAINLSLGSSSPGFTYGYQYQSILNSFATNPNCHAVVSISAGNAYAFDEEIASGLYAEDIPFHTGGSPGTFINSLCVASANNTSSTTARENATVSDFSSWGVPGSLLMKPEITAPGGNIYSVYGRTPTIAANRYGYMSGTSMAAPHIAGLTALVAEYLREHPVKNEALTERYGTRAIMQSLLMSTATPMKNSGLYLPILQQGAGLAEVSKAIDAPSVIMMDKAYLTTSTGAAADGKVKVELGDDPARTGSYTFSFNIYNLTDSAQTYTLDTALFTQAISGNNLSHETVTLPGGGVTYEWSAASYDVDQDGDTDSDDAQAVLDYLTGKHGGSDLDLKAADADKDGAVTTYDAHVILASLTSGNTVAAHGTAHVTVHIGLTDAQKAVFDARANGGYLEGFTYVTGTDGTTVEHTIPILGYYGSWTDPTMFDTNSYTEALYGNTQTNYSGVAAENTNYMTVTMNGTQSKFSGNPYKVEGAFPADRLAINSHATINSIVYLQVRSSIGNGFAITKSDDQGKATVLYDALADSYVVGLYYDGDYESWENAGTKSYTVNKTLQSVGVSEGDRVRIGFYAIPEYNVMRHSDDLTSNDAGYLSVNKFTEMLESSELGSGAFVGFDLTVDNTAPVIDTPSRSGNQLTVSVTDNANLAYVAVMSLDGTTVYADAVPGAASYSATVDIADALDNADGYVAVFAGDYAGNEKAYAYRVNDNGSGEDPNAISELSLTPTTLSLLKGAQATLTVSVLPITAVDRSVNWTSADTSVATVDEAGCVTGVGAGTTVIMATAVADPSKTASCQVTVTEVHQTLKGIVWDANGNVYFAQFDTDDPEHWTKLHSTAKSEYLTAAFIAPDGKLYAGEPDGSDEMALYAVNTSTYALTEHGTNYVAPTDIAIGASSSSYAQYIGMVYTYGAYLVAGNVEPAYDERSGNTYSGMPYALLNVSGKTFVGIACKERHSDGGVYYVLDTEGVIWETTLCFDSVNDSFVFSDLTKVLETGISTGSSYQTLYSDGTYLYWGHYDGAHTTELIIIDPVSGCVAHAGNFGYGVWPAAGFYSDTPVAVVSGANAVSDDVNVTPIELPDAIEAAPARAHNPVLRDINGSATLNGEQTTVTVVLSESEASTNGMFALDYDKDKLTYLGCEAGSMLTSVVEGDGKITVAYAAAASIDAGTPVLTVRFATPTVERSVLVTTMQRGNAFHLDEQETVAIPASLPSFKTQALELGGKIGIYMYLDLGMLEENVRESSKMTFTITGEGGDMITKEAGFDASLKNADGYYGFVCYVTSIQMADTVTATFHYGDDTVSKTFSVKGYIEKFEAIESSFDANTVAMVHALADYGHYAQPILASENGWTVNTDYAAMDTFYTESFDDATIASIANAVSGKAFSNSNQSNGDITDVNYTLALGSGTDILVYFTPKAGCELSGVKLDNVEIKDQVTTDENGRYCVRIADIAAHQLGSTHTVVLTTANGSVTVTVSAMSYVQGVLSGNPDADAKNMAAALYRYWQAAVDMKANS